MTDMMPGPNDGWNGPARHHASEFGPLLAELREIKRRLSALERAAPLRESGITLDTNSFTSTGTTTLGTSTSIAGVGMNTFITQQQAVRSEVIAARGIWPDLPTRIQEIASIATSTQDEVEDARGTWDDLPTRLSQISSIANGAQSEITGARGGHPNLDARLDTLASTGDLSSYATDAEVTAALNGLSSQIGTAFGVIIGHINTLGDIHSLGPFPSPWS